MTLVNSSRFILFILSIDVDRLPEQRGPNFAENAEQTLKNPEKRATLGRRIRAGAIGRWPLAVSQTPEAEKAKAGSRRDAGGLSPA